jgi:hypothetical protein
MTSRDQQIIELRFTEGKKLSEIGEIIGLTLERVRQIVWKNTPDGTNGRRRLRARDVKCRQCEKHFFVWMGTNRTCCSRKCQRQYNSVRCGICKEIKIPIYYSDNGRGRRCRDCTRELARKWRKSKSGRSKTADYVRKYNKTNPVRCQAWKRAQSIPRTPCITCGRLDSVRHHPDIKKPLEIVMLCPVHHKLAHRDMSMV